MTKMQIFGGFIIFSCIMFLTSALNNEVKFKNARINPHKTEPQYDNRDHYNNLYRRVPQYYERRFRNYNPEVLAPQARIINQEMQTPVDGAYLYSYDTDNGIHADEHGGSVQIGKDELKKVVEGSYSFVTPEGLHVLVRYTADENGYHPTITYGGVEGRQLAHRDQPAGVVLIKPN